MISLINKIKTKTKQGKKLAHSLNKAWCFSLVIVVLVVAGIVGVISRHLAWAANTTSQHELAVATISPVGNNVNNLDNVLYQIRGNTNYADATNVTAVVTATNAVFDRIPEICKTTGVTPVSNISTDGKTLTCNTGDWDAGTSFRIDVTARANGLNGETTNVVANVSSDNGAAVQASGASKTIVADFRADIGVWTMTANIAQY